MSRRIFQPTIGKYRLHIMQRICFYLLKSATRNVVVDKVELLA